MSPTLIVNKAMSPQEAKKAAMLAAKTATSASKPYALVRYIPASECPDRNRIVFDDSGSMDGYIKDAKNGVIEFLRNCIPNQTSVAVHFMNTSPDIKLQSDLVSLGNQLLEMSLKSGATPFFESLKKALQDSPKLTRLIAFTDGSPTDCLDVSQAAELGCTFDGHARDLQMASADVIIQLAKITGGGKCIPIDTVFFGTSCCKRENRLLEYLSAQTGGFFLRFDPSKPNIFKQLKYLAPVNRLRLTSPAFRAEVESGKV